MKCPQCGRWNRATLPRCFYCGAEFPAQETPQEDHTKNAQSDAPQVSGKVIYTVDESGRSAAQPDPRDQLAREMQSLHSRRKRGEEQQRRIRAQSAQSGFAPTGRGVWTQTRPVYFYDDAPESGAENLPPEGEVRPDAIPVSARRAPIAQYDDLEEPPAYQPLWQESAVRARPRARGMSPRSMRHVRAFGLRRFTPYIAALLILIALGACAYLFIIKPAASRKAPTLQERAIISASILNDMAAHTILIPAEEGAQIYIKELKKSYLVAGGYATVEVADYTWYELAGNITEPTMHVTLTPYIKTSAGEQKLMEVIGYDIDIPLSPLALVSPDVDYVDVSYSPYLIEFRVAQNSTVTINGEDFSSFVNTQDGYISYNATVLAIGENKFEIVVNCQYYRENRITLTLYRAKQDIPLELDATLGNSSAFADMTIKGSTIPGATVTVTTPHTNFDGSRLASTGEFSFSAQFNKIGTNAITIVAEKDGHTATITKNVYYVSYASTYTPKAWPMNTSAGYLDYLNNTATRVANTQIYLCQGTITEILGSKPQLALMDTDESETGERLVLLENKSGDTWTLGERYRVFADAYGVYNGMPRLVARYTYPPKD